MALLDFFWIFFFFIPLKINSAFILNILMFPSESWKRGPHQTFIPAVYWWKPNRASLAKSFAMSWQILHNKDQIDCHRFTWIPSINFDMQHADGFKFRLLTLVQYIDFNLCLFLLFFRWGCFVSKHPERVIIGCLVITALTTLGFFNIRLVKWIKLWSINTYYCSWNIVGKFNPDFVV